MMFRKSLKSLLVITCVLFNFSLQAQDVQEIILQVQTAGTLSSLIYANKYKITKLTLIGPLNGTDIRFIREMAGRTYDDNATEGKLSVLDLTHAHIVSGGGQYYSNLGTANNVISALMFRNCTSLTSVTIPSSVYSIGSSAFSGCTSLTSVTIPNSVTSIGSSAFSGCSSLSSVTIPSSVTSIQDYTFSGCSSLTSVTIPSSVYSIGSSAFSGCTSLTSVTIPSAVESIGSSAFRGCSNLEKINYNAINCTSTYTTSTAPFGNLSGLKTVNIGSQVEVIPTYLFYGCTALTTVTIPSAVESIGSSAFRGCSNLEIINYNAIDCTSTYTNSTTPFGNLSGLKTVNIGSQVKNIPACLFYGCTSLETINYNAIDCTSTYTNSTTPFGNLSGLKTVNIGSQVKNIPACLFYGCTNLEIINYNAINCTSTYTNSTTPFGNLSGLKTVNIGSQVEVIPTYLFYGCTALTTVTIPSAVESIGNYAFEKSAGLIVVDPSNLHYSSKDGVLYDKNETSLIQCPISITDKFIIPTSVIFIGNSAFSGCTALTTVTIPSAVESIGSSAFSGCSNLEIINYNAINCTSTYTTSTAPFGGLSGLKIVNIGSEVKNIPDNLFYRCTNLETINYNAKNCISIYTTSTTPFGSLGGVQTINIGDSVRFIPNYLFSNCTRIREINSKAAYPPSIDATTFQGVSRNIPVYPPVATREDYIFDPYWSEFFRIYAKDYVNNVVYLNKQMVSIMTVGSGYVLKQPVKSGESVSYLIQPESDFRIASLMVNGKNMLDSLDSNGYLNFSAIKEDINIVITPINTDIQHVVDKSGDNSISCWSADGKLFVVSNQEMAQVELIDLNGRILIQEQNNAFTYVLNQPNKVVNVIRVQLTNGEIKAVKVRSN